MSTWKIYTSTTEALMNETANYKNGETTQETFNQKMLLNLSYLIYSIKHPSKDDSENSDKTLLDFFLPISQLSYTMESKLNKTEDKFQNVIEKEDMFRLSSSTKDENRNEIQFEESPMIPAEQPKEDLYNVLDKDEDLTFNLLPRVSTNFDLSSIFNSDDMNLTDRRIEYSFYSDENKMSFGRKTRETSRITNSPGGSGSIGYRKTRHSSSNAKQQKKSIKIKEDPAEIFKDVLSKKAATSYIKEMSVSYVKLMLSLFNKIKEQAKLAFFCEDKMYLNLIKELLLLIGVSEKRIYEDTLRNIIYEKEIYNFETFLSCFHKLFKLKDASAAIKFKLLLYITTSNEKEITKKHLYKFFDLIRCKKVFDEELCEDITDNLVDRYIITYPGKKKYKRFNLQNMMLILESFFDNK